MRVIDGVGPDAEVVANEKGATASKVVARMDLLPAKALLELGKLTLKALDKYEVDNWRGFPIEDHLNRVEIHLLSHRAGDRQEGEIGHLTRVALRALFALELAIEEMTKSHKG